MHRCCGDIFLDYFLFSQRFSSRNERRYMQHTYYHTIIFIFIAFTNTRIYFVVKKLSRSENRPQDATVENLTRMKLFLRELKQAKSCFIVVICFGIFCFLPVTIAFPIYQSFDKYNKPAISIRFCTLGLLNSSVNSLIFFGQRRCYVRKPLS